MGNRFKATQCLMRFQQIDIISAAGPMSEAEDSHIGLYLILSDPYTHKVMQRMLRLDLRWPRVPLNT